MNSTSVHDPRQRFHFIQFAVRNHQWWRARQAIEEAVDAEDWRTLGYTSAEQYRTAAVSRAAA
jgi:hypothetical protein